jgi:alkylation response protein AidB-like acyl-CoA dehydrogenase
MTGINRNQESAEDIRGFSDAARDFAVRELIDKREEHDRYPFGELSVESIKSASDIGFYGVNLPTEYGGMNTRGAAIATILENLSIADASAAAIVFTNAAAIEVINQASQEADCSSIYKRLTEPGALPVSFHCYTAIGEIDAPRIDAVGAISGGLGFVSLGGLARYAVIPARAGDDKLSYYLVDLKGNGIKVSDTVYSIGLHACPAVDLTLERVSGYLIGISGEGEKYFDRMQSTLSVSAAAVSLGIIKGSFFEALQYAKERRQGGRPIIEWPEVKMMLANIAIEARVGQLCLASACQQIDAGVDGWEKATRAAAIHTAEMACRATTDGVQLLGGNGYMKDYGQEKRMRDAKQVQCFLGMAPVRKIDLIEQVIATGL